MQRYTLAIHGGAGTIRREKMTAEKEAAYNNGLAAALEAGYAVLDSGGSAVEAARAAVISLEDNILFNAGRGSVFAKDGCQEMDAAIMDGRNLEAGAVAAVRNIRNPIELAYEVMVHSDHVLLMGKGANDFALKQGVRMEPDEYFYSEFRYNQWQAVRNSDQITLDHSNEPVNKDNEKKFGTVGAVACDKEGNLAAATSTGGMTNKDYGRVGDSPLIGIGNYANNRTCAISCTGHGELFMRTVAAYDVSALMEYRGLTLQSAMDEVVNKKLLAIGGEGGMIGVDANGNPAMVLNSAGMYRAVKSSDGLYEIAIYR
jgi:L-asparaginase / beta-aspartyl-peptidase